MKGGILNDQERGRADHKAQLALGLIPDDTDRSDYLGTDKHGFLYYSRTDHYVYQYSPTGQSCGWIATIATWEQTLNELLA